MAILLGQTARELRGRLGMTQREAADALGITDVYLSNIENDKAAPSKSLIARYRELWGIDLYVLAWCSQHNSTELPKPLRKAADALAASWERHINARVADYRRERDR